MSTKCNVKPDCLESPNHSWKTSQVFCDQRIDAPGTCYMFLTPGKGFLRLVQVSYESLVIGFDRISKLPPGSKRGKKAEARPGNGV